jgi:hypothetical protein
MGRDYCWDEECLERSHEKESQFYAYVLEANLVFANGMTLPLFSEFLEYQDYEDILSKQDCELKAFYRLAARIKAEFPRLAITILLDGLYANGPVIALCRRNNWGFMIVLKDKSLPSVWREANGLHKLQTEQKLDMSYGNRRQHFWWVNDIVYEYKQDSWRQQTIHVVVCEESWEEPDKNSSEIVTKTSRHVWISNQALNKRNVHNRCNLMARKRWIIENGNFLVEKHHGYNYEHCFAYDWNAMKGYHYLMRLAHFINVLVSKSLCLADQVRAMGIQRLIELIRNTISMVELDAARTSVLINKKLQLRLD